MGSSDRKPGQRLMPPRRPSKHSSASLPAIEQARAWVRHCCTFAIGESLAVGWLDRRPVQMGFMALLLVGWLDSSICARADEIVVEPIRFSRGASKKIVTGAVIRGERSLYSIDARAGQRLTLSISAVENNAVFQLYAPGARPERRDYGVEILGQALAGATQGQDARRWTGILRQDGAYLLVVGPTRGNATYSLTVAIR
jgi:hypothetical protein